MPTFKDRSSGGSVDMQHAAEPIRTSRRTSTVQTLVLLAHSLSYAYVRVFISRI
ncbi:hypothetical protein FA13DRAFT_1723982 [Coprinellus micaceus]|uniref:Uncharacterized protein n=1 Tax=Coprinellus micaceus TaxID=71717 RepID=A0A4Y7U007_COPMI|nr:hypothetical protein FA13DRAFT_1723982 [Coprinellus micaceus]